MDKQLRVKADKLQEIYNEASRDFRWKNSSNMNNLIALFHVMKGREYSAERIGIINEYIKDNTSVFPAIDKNLFFFSFTGS